MSKTKALVVGVSNYYIEGAKDLYFCKNDILAIKGALINGLKLSKHDIFTLGNSGKVTKNDFRSALLKLSNETDQDDIVLFYFSGHGGKIEGKHCLIFSDGWMNTQEIIKHFEKIKAKSKIILLDCCYAGDFTVSEALTFDIVETVNEFNGKGYAVFSSSSSSEVSFCHPQKPISLFTNFLCDAFQDKYLIKKGKISLYDIQRLVSMKFESWNKKGLEIQQQPIFRANIGGTIYFQIEEYTPFPIKKIYQEHKNYTLFSVEPVHHGLAKRYSVKVILKKPHLINEIIQISEDIKNIVSKVEVYSNKISEKHWTHKPANIIWTYFGYNESDLLNSNYIYNTTWVDDKQDKKHWYKIYSTNQFVKNDIHCNINQDYKSLKEVFDINTTTKEVLILETNKIFSKMIPLAENAISYFNEFKNKTINEIELFDKMEYINTQLDNYYFLSGDLAVAPDEIHEWSQVCSKLFCSIHNFTCFYNKKYTLKRSSKNRIDCMNMTIKNYYLALNKFNEI